ncbi:hypothetical protein [Microbacterium sp.]|uniref:hypothetical protein n=1 Tax=Microbacterium sp. TaxID=51671 RepID=UPI003A9378C2
MVGGIEILRAVARAPLHTVRLRDLAGLGANVWRAVDRLTEQGALTRIVHGVYSTPPDGRDGRTWKPPFEAAALALATARFGARQVALMGVSAARHWGAIPRAIGVAHIAVPRGGYAPTTLDRGGIVRFIPRDLDRLDLIVERTALGDGLVTTPAQTLFDLLVRRDTDELATEIAGAVRNLVPLVQTDEFEKVARRQNRRRPAVEKMTDELRARDAETG